jgi:phosphatidylglycerophosphatase A
MPVENLSTRVWQDPVYFIAFGFGSGLMPVAPGTWGTLAAIPLYLIVASLSPLFYLLVLIALFLGGVWVSDIVTRDLGVNDYSGIVWDEVAGYLATMFCAPYGVIWMVTGFLLFRLFDILKPPPISLVDQHIKGGIGVMLDDVVAAIPACLILQALAWIFKS